MATFFFLILKYLFILGEKYVAVRKPRAKVCFLLPPSGSRGSNQDNQAS